LIYLIFLNYRANEKHARDTYYHLDKNYYINKLISDLGFYQKNLYQNLLLDEPRMLEKFKTKLSSLFDQLSIYIQPLFKVENLIDSFINQKGFTGTYSTYDTVINIDVSYSLIISNLKEKNLEHLRNIKSSIDTLELTQMYGYQDIFLDIRSFLVYDNFNFTTYFDYIFLGSSLHKIHKFVLALRALMFTSYSETLYDYIIDNRKKLNGTTYPISSTTDTGVLVTDIFPDELLQQIITHNLDPLFYSRLYTICESNPFRYVDSIFHYYAYTHENKINKEIITQIIDDSTSLNMGNTMYLIEDIAKNFPRNLIDGIYYKYTQNVITVYEYLIHPEEDYQNFLIQNVFNVGSTGAGAGVTGTGVTGAGVTGATESALDLLKSYLNQNKFDGINFDGKSFDHKVITHNYLTKSMKLIYCLLKKPRITDLSLNTVFGTDICNYLWTKKLKQDLYNQIYALFTQNQIDETALKLFLLEYSFTENKVSKSIKGKYVEMDLIKDIQLDHAKYMSNLKTYIQPINSSLATWIENNRISLEQVILQKYFHIPFHNFVDSEKMLDKHYINNMTQSINESNYSYFIDQVVLEEIENPHDFMKLLQSVYIVNDQVRFLIRDTLKNNYSKYLNISFYTDWMKLYISDEQGIDNIVTSTLGYLLSKKMMTEEELYKISLEFDYLTSTLLYKNLNRFYQIKENPVEIGQKYYPAQSANNRVGVREALNSTRTDNIYDLLKSMDVNNTKMPSGDKMKKLSSETPIVDIKRTQDEINDEINQDKKSEQDQLNGQGENPDQKAKKLFENNKMVDLYRHLKKLAETRPELKESLKHHEERTNGVVMAWQIIISLFDPTQVLSDQLCEKMIRSGVLRDIIDRWKQGEFKTQFKMDLSNYTSFMYAWVLATAALIQQGYNPWIKLAVAFAFGMAIAIGILYSTSGTMAPVGLSIAAGIIMGAFADLDSPTNEQMDLAVNYIESQDMDDESVNDGNINFRLGPYIFVNMFKRIFNIKDPIRAAKKAELGITSSIAKINYEVGKMIVPKGGDGMIKIQKN
jgi:hypothetical protein